MKQGDIVKVSWLDACNKDVSDVELGRMIACVNGNEFLVETESIGELIKINKSVVILRHNKSQETEKGDDNELVIIPKDWTTKIEVYNGRKFREKSKYMPHRVRKR